MKLIERADTDLIIYLDIHVIPTIYLGSYVINIFIKYVSGKLYDKYINYLSGNYMIDILIIYLESYMIIILTIYPNRFDISITLCRTYRANRMQTYSYINALKHKNTH